MNEKIRNLISRFKFDVPEQKALKALDTIKNYIEGSEERVARLRREIKDFRKDDEIKKLDDEVNGLRRNAIRVLYGEEIEKNKLFRQKHWNKCSADSYWYKLTETGLGSAITIKCDVCGEEEDITDATYW